MSKPSSVIVVLEDHRQRVRPSPSAEGSAERWVRKTFVTETGRYRTRQAHASSALIAMIDADTHTVRDRLAQLDRELTAVGKPPVSNDEQIARLIPKRNVETWILCLNGTVVNEETDYKGKSMNWNQLASTAANALSLSTQSGTADLAVFTESLRIGIVELKKIPL